MNKEFLKLLAKNINKIKDENSLNKFVDDYNAFKQKTEQQWDFNLENEPKPETKLEQPVETKTEEPKTEVKTETLQEPKQINEEIAELTKLLKENFSKTDNNDKIDTIKETLTRLKGFRG